MASDFFNKQSARRFPLVVASVAFAYAPILYFHTRSVLQRTYYQFVPILVAACGYLLWQQFKEPDRYFRLPRLEVTLLAIAFALLVPSVILFSPWIGALSAIFAVGSLLVYLGGRCRLMELIPVWGLLWLILPPPFGFDIQLVSKLQAFTSVRASQILDYIGINHFMSGNILEFTDQRLLVEEACSGVQSLFALFAYTAIYVVWQRVPLLRAFLLILTSAFWAGALNVVRVLSIAIAADRFKVDLSSGWRHEVLGLVVFVIALVLIASTDQWLKFCLRFTHGVSESLVRRSRIARWVLNRIQPANDKDLNQIQDEVGGYGVWKSAIVCGAFLLIGVSQLGMMGLAAANGPSPALVDSSRPDALMLPEALGDWSQTDFETEKRSASSIFGQHSRIWTYDAPLGEVTFAFDYPFGSWHDLRVCYGGAGWTVVSTTKDVFDIDGQPFEYLAVDMTQEDGRIGFLVFAEFENNGRPVNPVTVSDDSSLPLASYMAAGLKDRWAKGLVNFGVPVRTYQVQMLFIGDVSPTEYERQQLTEQFKTAAVHAYNATTTQQAGGVE